MAVVDDAVRARLLRRGLRLEYVTLGWNAAGIIVLGIAAVAARSAALAGFGLNSVIEIGASAVVVWTAVTAVVMFSLAAGKARTGRALDNPVLSTEGRVTMVDGILAAAVLAGLVRSPDREPHPA